MDKKKALVIGSVNIDSTFQLERLPVLGETILAHEKYKNIGGKGLNQAVALNRMGLNTTFMPAIGTDLAANSVIEYLENENLNKRIITKVNSDTGEAIIIVDKNGDNMIIPYLGANSLLSVEDIENNLDVFEDIDVCVLQLEIPISTVEYIVNYCYKKNIKVVLNPAPASRDLSWDLLKKVDYLIPNETELEIIAGQKVTFENLEEIGQEAIAKGINKLIVTAGRYGAYYFDKETFFNVPVDIIEVVDSTAAGDTFIGAFVSKIVKNESPESAIKFANKAAGITISKKGAAESIPVYTDV